MSLTWLPLVGKPHVLSKSPRFNQVPGTSELGETAAGVPNTEAGPHDYVRIGDSRRSGGQPKDLLRNLAESIHGSMCSRKAATATGTIGSISVSVASAYTLISYCACECRRSFRKWKRLWRSTVANMWL